VINGVLPASEGNHDPLAAAIAARGKRCARSLPNALRAAAPTACR
jgi:hypothetical protein